MAEQSPLKRSNKRIELDIRQFMLYRNIDRSEQGVALLMVLWVLTILMGIALSFSFMAGTETHSTISFKEGIEEKFLAEAGIERGLTELFYRNIFKNQTVLIEGTEVWKIDGTSYKGQIGDSFYIVKILDESGKLDINTVSDVVLKNLLVNHGIEAEVADTVVDSIMDWRDPDDLYRLHGAESDYYMSLPNPYEAKNADFDTLEELILVKGVTAEILYGSREKRGIIDFLTVNSKTDKININAAPREVLTAIPGVTEETADWIINYRQNKEIPNLQEIQEFIGENPYISISGTNTFTIDSVGKKSEEKGGYGIRATISISGDEIKYVYYKSPARISQ
ncbi:MAG: hypothetical protein AB1390_00370 [Nitrospirota bacterium]